MLSCFSVTAEIVPGTRPTTPPASQSHSEAVGFLLSQLGFAVSRRFGELLETLDLEPRHFSLMRAIGANEGQAQHVLAATLHIPASSLVSLVDDLEARGLVERRSHPTDRRARTLHLTAAGTERLEAALAVAAGLEAHLCAGIGPDERLVGVGVLKRVGQNLGLVDGVHPNVGRGPDGLPCTDERGLAPPLGDTPDD